MRGIDVWSGSLDRTCEEVSDLSKLLNADEKARAQRFHRNVDRARYIAGRGILRTLIGEYTSTPPGLVPLSVLANGKPSLHAKQNAATVNFNLSHCGALALFAFSDREIGIDLQRIEANADIPRVVANFFSPEEVATYEQLGESNRVDFFFRTWVRKEAYLKATGEGFTVDPATLSVGDSIERGALLNKPGKTGVAESFQIRDIDEIGGHAAAIAFADDGTSPEIRFRLT